jgi:ribose-phosphate pyrophosphokinase
VSKPRSERSYAPQPPRGLKLFAGASHPALAQEICGKLGIPLGRSHTTRFSNENLKVKIDENVREQDVFVVQTACPSLSEHILELLILLDALKHSSAHRVTAVMPYFPYARSDKKDEPRISITARLMADLLATAGANRVLTVDLHSPQTQGFFSIPADQLTGVPVLCERLLQGDLSNTVVVAADVGEAKDSGHFAKRLKLPLAFIDKRRTGDDEQARPAHIIGEIAGKDCLLVDDEIATGGTIFGATDFLLNRGARSVTAAVVHPVLSGPAFERLGASRLQRLLVTNTIPLPSEKASSKIEVLSLGPLLATAILRIHDGQSVSELFG